MMGNLVLFVTRCVCVCGGRVVLLGGWGEGAVWGATAVKVRGEQSCNVSCLLTV